ncbi:extracellular calcium-sensing receptor-like [Polypterus senegalus]|uniref:extracellular calcium-sensing receptor-like n=1 Tax=Polypterus senegalus TaxID=55291 RepID=UPI001963CF08|nr:extracellular calcium-sensing receptor-like [Polypterus senegalus]
MLLLKAIFFASFARAENDVCKLWQAKDPALYSKDGDIIIGGIFSFHRNFQVKTPRFTTMPEALKCENINYREFRLVQTMIFAIEEINRNSERFSGITLGYRIYDACGSITQSIKSAMLLLNLQDEIITEQNCVKPSSVIAIIGHSESSLTIGIVVTIGQFHVPLISHSSGCECLSNKKEFPTFFRTIPSNYYQSMALAELLKYFGWSWVGTIQSDNDYGNYGMATFLQAAQRDGMCIEYSVSIHRTYPRAKFLETVKVIKASSSKVIVVFATFVDFEFLVKELLLQNVTGIQWVGSESWITAKNFAGDKGNEMLRGAIGLATSNSLIAGLNEFLLSLQPSDDTKNSFFKAFWEDVFNCTLINKTGTINKTVCTGSENLREVNNQFTDVTDMRIPNNVYKAVYAIAYAIQNLVMCKNTEEQYLNKTCQKSKIIQPWQLLPYLKTVNFTFKNGENVHLEEDANVQYEVINWQLTSEGMTEFITVGYYDTSLLVNQRFTMKNIRIIYTGNQTQVPTSICSDDCPPGTRKAVQKGKPVCCFDCIKCAEGEISKHINSIDCVKCPPEFWSNEERNTCIEKEIEFLSFVEIMGIFLITISLAGATLSITIAFIFFNHRDTPVVKANNSELSFLLLFSLTLCFLCSLTFIGQPSEWSCIMRHTTFGVTFVLCISCVLGKTIVVLMAFRATLPGNNIMKWFGPIQQRLSVCSLTLIQIFICIMWLILSPPFPNKNTSAYKEKIILECNMGSTIAFYSVIGYFGMLSLLCFLLAFLARKLPDNFNEAKFITFSMLIFCAVWITFIPAYISSLGKYTVAVEIFAILASSFGLLFCIFAPKCYIILLKPEKNTRKHVMGK